MTIQEATYHFLSQLRHIYPEGEAVAITDRIMEFITGSKNIERMMHKNEALLPDEEEKVGPLLRRLLSQEPLQYVTGEAWFCGLKFYVDKNVLIPRPETEELVEWIISNVKFPVESLRILDIGTGSGCIAVSLKRRIRKAEVWACDLSEAALTVARKNAEELGASVNFRALDFLNTENREQLPVFDIIVSNPPYIPEQDKSSLQPNVLNHEPAVALFVPDRDPLVFYRAIAAFGQTHLTPGGRVYTEIHENLGEATLSVFIAAGYSAELKKDMQGKNRMVKAERR